MFPILHYNIYLPLLCTGKKVPLRTSRQEKEGKVHWLLCILCSLSEETFIQKKAHPTFQGVILLSSWDWKVTAWEVLCSRMWDVVSHVGRWKIEWKAMMSSEHTSLPTICWWDVSDFSKAKFIMSQPVARKCISVNEMMHMHQRLYSAAGICDTYDVIASNQSFHGEHLLPQKHG